MEAKQSMGTATHPAKPEDETQYKPFDPADDDQGILSDIDKQYASTPPDVPRRIHILGTGSIGKIVAHALKGLAKPPPITLIFHRKKLLEAWDNGKQEITIHDDGYDTPRSGFEVEYAPPPRREHGVEVKEGQESVYETTDRDGGQKPHEVAEQIKSRQAADQASGKEQERSPSTEKGVSDEPIDSLIVTTKAPFTVSALAAVKHRLSADSTICFLQNGMGVVDEVNKELFPNEEDRPSYIQGIVTHGANVPPEKAAEDPFYAVHAGHGTISLGLLPRGGIQASKKDEEGKSIQDEKWAPSARYLLRTLTRCPVLCAVGFVPIELFQLQLEKLVMNSVINPLTALIDHRNGALLYNMSLTRTMRLLLNEISHVITSLPELEGVANVQNRFSASRLESVVVSMANKTKDNISSMLADVRAGNRTEIEYINGYIVKRGEELGVKCVVNYAIMHTVMGKAQMIRREVSQEVPTEEMEGQRLSGQ